MLNLLSVITAGSSFFLAFLVFCIRRDANVLANRWLAAFLLLLSIFLIDDCLLIYGLYEAHPYLIGWFGLPAFALAPTLYRSVSCYVSLEKRFHPKDLWHFAPFILFVLLSLPFLLFANETQRLDEIKPVEAWTTHIWDYILLIFLFSQVLIYCWFSYQKLRKHHKNVEDISSSPETVNLDWLQFCLLGIFGMIAVWLFDIVLRLPDSREASWATPFYLAAVYFLGYHALRQREVFPFAQQASTEISEMLEDNETPVNATRRQFFTEQQREQLKQRLNAFMEVDKPYLDNNLTLPELARRVGLRTHELSYLVNEAFGENFAQFINRFRVEESKSLLLSDHHTHLNMVGIAYAAGFNSKTAFNTAFKKRTGISPTEFQKQGLPGIIEA